MTNEKLYTKTFTYEGQMINYYNKVRTNPKIDKCWCGVFTDTGYTVAYTYKHNNTTH